MKSVSIVDNNFENTETGRLLYSEYWKRLRNKFMENVEKEYEFTLEELNKVCLEAVNTTPVKNRKMVIFTSKLGYINFLEVLYSRKLTQIEKDNIPEEIYKI